MKEEIYNELIEMAPKLCKMGNENPFKVPNGYFRNLQNILISKGNGTSNSLPIDYFDQLPNKLWSKFNTNEEISSTLVLNRIENKKPRIFSLNRSFLSKIAASFVILIASTLYFNWNGTVQDEALNYKLIETNEMISFLEHNDQEMETDIYDIYESVISMDMEISIDISDSELNNYLEDHIEEYEDDIL